MPKYKCKTPVRHDGEDYGPGDTIELNQKQADAMGSDVLDTASQPKAEKNGDGATK